MLYGEVPGCVGSKREECTDDVTSKTPKERCQRPSLQGRMNGNELGKIGVTIPAKGGPSRVQWE
jgi:hypothetical protein